MAEVEKEKAEQARGTLLKFVNPLTGAGVVRKNFTKIPNSIIFDRSVKAQDKELYNILLALPYRKRQSDTGDGILITHEYLRALMGAKDRKTILSSISRLEKAGYCKRAKISGKLSELQVIIKPSETEKQEKVIEEMLSDA